MTIVQSPTFFRFVKKVESRFKAEIDKQVLRISKEPGIGCQKKGDLQEVRVQKFTYARLLYLLAYRVTSDELQLIMIGTHENFYRDLKTSLK